MSGTEAIGQGPATPAPCWAVKTHGLAGHTSRQLIHVDRLTFTLQARILKKKKKKKRCGICILYTFQFLRDACEKRREVVRFPSLLSVADYTLVAQWVGMQGFPGSMFDISLLFL